MKATLGKTYPDGSRDLTLHNMSLEMTLDLLRLGMIKAVEDGVKNNAEWLQDLGREEE